MNALFKEKKKNTFLQYAEVAGHIILKSSKAQVTRPKIQEKVISNMEFF